MVMPFYLICDVSYSMSGDMVALNDGVQKLRQSIVGEPLVDDVGHISVMTFSLRKDWWQGPRWSCFVRYGAVTHLPQYSSGNRRQGKLRSASVMTQILSPRLVL